MWGSHGDHSIMPQNLSSRHPSPVDWKDGVPKLTLSSLFSSLSAAPKILVTFPAELWLSLRSSSQMEKKKKGASLSQGRKNNSEISNANIGLPHPPNIGY